MSRILISLVTAIGLAATALGTAAAQTIPSGSYQQSCTNIRVRGDQLTARCANAQGTRVRSTLELDSCRGGDIANSNGQLVCNGGSYNNGNHRRHRRDRDDDGNNNNNNNGGYYNNGSYNNGSYNNGRYGNGTIPSGSYQSSCTNVQINGPMLSATCTAANGSTYSSQINANRCRGADIANVNGRLVCR